MKSCCQISVAVLKGEAKSQKLYTVVVVRNKAVVGHLQKQISKLCSPFTKRGRTIEWRITGSRRYLVDIPQRSLMFIPKIGRSIEF